MSEAKLTVSVAANGCVTIEYGGRLHVTTHDAAEAMRAVESWVYIAQRLATRSANNACAATPKETSR